ncbi:hypothetical protein EO98_15020 [Methanosarcina sp. 2.H.T.1A.6]|nr:hypothetical protein EO94_00630 [Methanosarcina sp. 2.H.T.1A.3]KKG17136.1 hypothetical protein EO97_20205 [Methanosarcina sp. 2.H.T.1A.15]KKG22823.1 hypothetical protein EO98_15020 [Methanosarcina sp. 2.H.T.1A.6]KKG24447.1 hypothetical protein EO96_14845 [Methanosarcina sp. 2.H.T.1A.8]
MLFVLCYSVQGIYTNEYTHKTESITYNSEQELQFLTKITIPNKNICVHIGSIIAVRSFYENKLDEMYLVETDLMEMDLMEINILAFNLLFLILQVLQYE